MSKDIEMQKHFIEKGFGVLTDHVEEMLEHDNVLPSSISVPYNEGDQWIRLHLTMSPIRDVDPEAI